MQEYSVCFLHACGISAELTERRMESTEGRTVRLISAEGFEFVVDYEAACVSNTIKNMLSSKGALQQTDPPFWGDGEEKSMSIQLEMNPSERERERAMPCAGPRRLHGPCT